VIMVTAMFAFSASMIRTGAAEMIGGRLFRACAHHEILLQVAILSITAACSMFNGRVMPADTLARLTLLVMNHHGTCTTPDGRNVPQARWLLDVFMMPEHADGAKVFEVTNPEVLGLFGWQETGSKAANYSFNDFKPFLVEIEKQAGLAAQTEPTTRNAFQRGVIKLRDALGLCSAVEHSPS